MGKHAENLVQKDEPKDLNRWTYLNLNEPISSIKWTNEREGF